MSPSTNTSTTKNIRTNKYRCYTCIPNMKSKSVLQTANSRYMTRAIFVSALFMSSLIQLPLSLATDSRKRVSRSTHFVFPRFLPFVGTGLYREERLDIVCYFSKRSLYLRELSLDFRTALHCFDAYNYCLPYMTMISLKRISIGSSEHGSEKRIRPTVATSRVFPPLAVVWHDSFLLFGS